MDAREVFYIRYASLPDLPAVLERSRRVLKLDADARPENYYIPRFVLLAIEGDRVLGHTAWSQHDTYALWDETVVESEYQGRGVGRALMERRLLASEGRIFGSTKDTNLAMKHLLDTFGFTVVQRMPDAYGPGEDALVYERTR